MYASFCPACTLQTAHARPFRPATCQLVAILLSILWHLLRQAEASGNGDTAECPAEQQPDGGGQPSESHPASPLIHGGSRQTPQVGFQLPASDSGSHSEDQLRNVTFHQNDAMPNIAQESPQRSNAVRAATPNAVTAGEDAQPGSAHSSQSFYDGQESPFSQAGAMTLVPCSEAGCNCDIHHSTSVTSSLQLHATRAVALQTSF